jgi:hypothetical protein
MLTGFSEAPVSGVLPRKFAALRGAVDRSRPASGMAFTAIGAKAARFRRHGGEPAIM